MQQRRVLNDVKDKPKTLLIFKNKSVCGILAMNVAYGRKKGNIVNL